MIPEQPVLPKWLLVVLLALVMAAALIVVADRASAGPFEDHRRVRLCHDIEWERGTYQVARLVRCAHRVWDAPGTPAQSVARFSCESGLFPRAYNPNGPYVGIAQHALSAWDERVARYIRPLEFHATYWGNAEINVIAAMRMAKQDGDWHQWGC